MDRGISSRRLRQTVRVLLFSIVLLTLVFPAAYGATTQVWVRRYNGPAGDTDVPNAITTGNGRVYVTGFSESTNKAEDYATIAYGAGGHRKWVARYSGPDAGFDQGNDVGVAPSGHVYVTGGSRGVVSGADYATVKYTQ